MKVSSTCHEVQHSTAIQWSNSTTLNNIQEDLNQQIFGHGLFSTFRIVSDRWQWEISSASRPWERPASWSQETQETHERTCRRSRRRSGARCISVHLGAAMPVDPVMFKWCLSDVCGPSPLKIISIFRCYFHVSWTLVSSEQFVSAVLFNFPCRRGQLRFKLVWLHLCRVARVEALVIRAAQGWSEHWALAGDQPEIY